MFAATISQLLNELIAHWGGFACCCKFGAINDCVSFCSLKEVHVSLLMHHKLPSRNSEPENRGQRNHVGNRSAQWFAFW